MGVTRYYLADHLRSVKPPEDYKNLQVPTGKAVYTSRYHCPHDNSFRKRLEVLLDEWR